MVAIQRELAGATGLIILFVTGNHPTSPTQLSLFTIQTPDVPGATPLFSSQRRTSRHGWQNTLSPFI